MSAPKLPDGVVLLGYGDEFLTPGEYFTGWGFCSLNDETAWNCHEAW